MRALGTGWGRKPRSVIPRPISFASRLAAKEPHAMSKVDFSEVTPVLGIQKRTFDQGELYFNIPDHKDLHPLCLILPWMSEKELEELSEDIRKNGLKQPIRLCDGKLLDGKNRALACWKAGVEPRYEEGKDGNPAATVASLNIRRRHLNESQRAMMAAQLLEWAKDHPAEGTNLSPTIKKVATELNVSPMSIKHGRKVLKSAPKQVIAKVVSGETAVSAAAVQIREEEKADQQAKEPLAIPEVVLPEVDLVNLKAALEKAYELTKKPITDETHETIYMDDPRFLSTKTDVQAVAVIFDKAISEVTALIDRVTSVASQLRKTKRNLERSRDEIVKNDNLLYKIIPKEQPVSG